MTRKPVKIQPRPRPKRPDAAVRTGKKSHNERIKQYRDCAFIYHQPPVTRTPAASFKTARNRPRRAEPLSMNTWRGRGGCSTIATSKVMRTITFSNTRSLMNRLHFWHFVQRTFPRCIGLEGGRILRYRWTPVAVPEPNPSHLRVLR